MWTLCPCHIVFLRHVDAPTIFHIVFLRASARRTGGRTALQGRKKRVLEKRALALVFLARTQRAVLFRRRRCSLVLGHPFEFSWLEVSQTDVFHRSPPPGVLVTAFWDSDVQDIRIQD